MKNHILILIVLLISQTADATIWQVDNNLNSPQPLNDVQDAIDNYAIAGDTIYIEGSATPYGQALATKSITIIGEGYYDLLSETVLLDVDVRASDVYISGIRGSILFSTNLASFTTINNVTVERCYLQSGTISIIGNPNASSHAIASDIAFRNNIFDNVWVGFAVSSQFDTKLMVDSIILENNIFTHSGFQVRNPTNTIGLATFILRNNLFIDGVRQNANGNNTLFYDGFFFTAIYDAVIYNNIFYAANPQGCTTCTLFNNLSFQNGVNDSLPSSQNNIVAQDPLFVNYPLLGGTFDFTHDYHLQQTPIQSPCIGTGNPIGTDIGIYGGLYPFEIGAGPKIPIVDYVNISNNAVQQNSTFYLQFDAKVRK
ncbi:MAG: hypothetical protein KA450_15195 [Bacteroidia bacterium]|nr:hypothetical protein [Bacteroidia bacterium]